MANGTGSFWTKERKEQLKAMADSGMTNRAIAAALGTSSGSVSGIRDRMRNSGGWIAARKPTPDRAIKPKRNFATFGMPPAPKPDRHIMPEYPASNTPVALLDLTNETCRWPIGEPNQPGFHFCGKLEAANDQRRPYCKAHSCIAFTGFGRR